MENGLRISSEVAGQRLNRYGAMALCDKHYKQCGLPCITEGKPYIHTRARAIYIKEIIYAFRASRNTLVV